MPTLCRWHRRRCKRIIAASQHTGGFHGKSKQDNRPSGNAYIEHKRAGKPPLLAYKYEMLSDGRKFEHPVNYALVRIVAPVGIATDEALRPFIIVDPRAGHGPGIGGFKADSEVGVALLA